VVDNGLNRFYVNGAWISDVKIVRPVEIDYAYLEAVYPWLPGFALERSEVVFGHLSEDIVSLLVLSNGLMMERHIIIPDCSRYATIVDFYGNPTNTQIAFTAEYDTIASYYTDTQYKLPGVHNGGWFSVPLVQLVTSHSADYILARTFNESAISNNTDAPHDAIAAGQRPIKIVLRWSGLFELYYEIAVGPNETKKLIHYVIATSSDGESEATARHLADSDTRPARPLSLSLQSFSVSGEKVFLDFSLNDWFGSHVADANVSLLTNGYKVQATGSSIGYKFVMDLSDLASASSLNVTARRAGYANVTNTIPLNLTDISYLNSKFNLIMIYAAGTSMASVMMAMLLVRRNLVDAKLKRFPSSKSKSKSRIHVAKK
jgi:hypothetical protein